MDDKYIHTIQERSPSKSRSPAQKHLKNNYSKSDVRLNGMNDSMFSLKVSPTRRSKLDHSFQISAHDDCVKPEDVPRIRSTLLNNATLLERAKCKIRNEFDMKNSVYKEVRGSSPHQLKEC